MTLLPSVREQLEQAAMRRAHPQPLPRASAGLKLGMARAAIALGLVAALVVAGLGVLGAGERPPPEPPGPQTGATPARLVQIAYVQTSAPLAGLSLSTPLRAHPVDEASGGYEIAVSFAQRLSLAGPDEGYSGIARGPDGRVLHAFTMPAGGEQAGARAVLLRLGEGLPKGVYRGMVELVYDENPALLEDSETVSRPVGIFQVRVP